LDVIGDPAESDRVRSARRLEGWQADLAYALGDGLIALGTAVAVAVLSLVVVVYAGTNHLQGGPADFFSLGVWLTGTSLGVPVHMTLTETVGPHQSLSEVVQVRAIVWLLTAIVLVLLFLLARRRERTQPSAGSGRAAAKAVLTAIVVTAALLVLALATTRSSIFGSPVGGVIIGARSHASLGLEPGFVFAGPLLLSACAALAGRAAGRGGSHGPATARHTRVADELSRWWPVLRTAWRQILVTGGLAGVTLLIYLAVDATQHGGAKHTAVIVIGLFLLLPNLAIYGTLGGGLRPVHQPRHQTPVPVRLVSEAGGERPQDRRPRGGGHRVGLLQHQQQLRQRALIQPAGIRPAQHSQAVGHHLRRLQRRPPRIPGLAHWPFHPLPGGRQPAPGSPTRSPPSP